MRGVQEIRSRFGTDSQHFMTLCTSESSNFAVYHSRNPFYEPMATSSCVGVLFDAVTRPNSATLTMYDAALPASYSKPYFVPSKNRYYNDSNSNL
jgi:hypothetical protein